MILDRSTFVRTTAAFLLGTAALSTAGAQERTLFTLSSTVDREVRIVVRGRDVQVRGSGLDASYRPHLDLRQALPRANGHVVVRLVNGRGTLHVLEQPSARNGYATTIRVLDPRSGADHYRLVASWIPARTSGFDPRDGRRGDDRWGDRDRDNCDHPNRNNGRGRDDDRCDDRRRDNDRWDNRDRDRDDGRWGNHGRGGRDDSRIIRWSGQVDDVSEIRISGRRVEYRTHSGAPVRYANVDMRGSGLPRASVTLSLVAAQGRGHVRIVQQPHRSNGYTAVIRVLDPRSGYGAYGFGLAW